MNTKEIIRKIDEAKKNLEECILLLNKQTLNTKQSVDSKIEKMTVNSSLDEKIDFSINERAFFKKYSKIFFSGREMFVLIVAYLANGEENKEVSLSNIQKIWGKVEGICHSKYAGIYTTRAKENDWVNSSKSGMYILRPKWKEIFIK